MSGIFKPAFTALTLTLMVPGVTQAEPGSAGSKTQTQQCIGQETSIAGGAPCVSLHGAFSSQFHLRNDTDFDSTARYDDVDGQTDGQLATFFSPKLTVDLSRGVSLVYELELGWNAWGQNSPGQPNQFGESSGDGLSARHTQIWAEWADGAYRLRAGYQPVSDPSGLFIDQNMGAATLRVAHGAHGWTMVAGQLTDSTIEGMSVREDNFVTDTFLFGAQYDWSRGALTWDTAVYAVIDLQQVGRPLTLGTAVTGVELAHDNYRAWFHLAGQFGRWKDGAIGGEDVTLSGYAAQAGAMQSMGRLHWGVNLFALSADDDHDGNEVNSAFLGSAKNRSPSVFLTEDEGRDRYDNLDERLSSSWGSLIQNPAGLAVIDASIGYEVTEEYRSTLVIAYALTTNSERALGASDVGTEISLLNQLALGPNAGLFLNGLVFLPGEAAAAFVNDIDRSATETLFGLSTGMSVTF